MDLSWARMVRVRAGAGVGDLEQVEKCGDLHLLGVVAGVGFGEVEDEVGVAFGEPEQRLRAAVENVIRRLVAELLQGFEDLLAVLLFRLLLAFLLAPCACAAEELLPALQQVASSHRSYSMVTFNFVPVMRPPWEWRVCTPQG